jgi:PAS domain S-box-containing protein
MPSSRRNHHRARPIRMRSSGSNDTALYSAILDLAQVIVRDMDGRLVDWSTGSERLYGWSPDEAVSQSCHRLLATEFPKPFAEIEAELRLNGHWQGELTRRTRDGRVVHVATQWALHRDADGKPIRIVEVDCEITEQKQAEKRLKEQIAVQIREREQIENQLHRSQKMEAVGQLTGGIAHDFNNLLTVISGNLEILHTLIGVDESRAQKLIDSARNGIERAGRLTEQLLAFSRQQKLRPETVSLNKLLSEFQSLIARGIGEAVEIRYDFDPILWSCRVDAAQFQSSILNLVLNARDAMPDGGRVTIQTLNVELDREQGCRLDVPPGSYVCVSVADAGHGISPDLMEKIFEPFYTTKGKGKGSGLGLSQVYGFVRQSDGAIGAEIEVGQGATFSVYFPRVIAPQSVNTRPDTTDDFEDAPEGTEMILVVEDDVNVLDLLLVSLTDLGYQVLSARNGEQALGILRGPCGKAIDVLLTDVVLPHGSTGIELAHVARQKMPGIEVLLMSGYDRVAPSVEFPMLTKPFRQTDLASKLRSILDHEATA